ncbi:MAG: hypothetical protein AAF494_08010 [Pseudomonadota bacterium]
MARSTLSEQWPINGLRHPPEGRSNGWYIWVGEESSDATDFFEPLCWEHLVDYLPQALDFLTLPPGWRFLLAPDYADVWFDEDLLKLDTAK